MRKETIYPRLEPLLTSISSPEAQKRIINRIVFGSIFLFLFLGGLALYSTIYWAYIPIDNVLAAIIDKIFFMIII